MAKSHQYLVYPPRLSITACIRLGILSTSLLMLRWPILRHSSCSAVASSSRFDGWTSRLLTARSRASHACSIGLQLGEYAGHGNWSICCSWRKSCTTCARCGGALSYWSRTFLLKRCLACRISSVCNSCRYLSPLTEFCSTTLSVFPSWWIPPQTWTETPPAMTVPTTQSSRNRAAASHRLFRQSDEAKTWTHLWRLHGANVLSHSDDAVVPTKTVSVCANH